MACVIAAHLMPVVLVDGKLKKHLFFAILLAALFIAKYDDKNFCFDHAKQQPTNWARVTG